MGKRNDNIRNMIFVGIIVFMIIIPAAFVNTEKEYRSEIDNSMLIEFPEFNKDFPAMINRYVEERIGFRVKIIATYQHLNNIIFHYLAQPLYEYGKGEWIMTKNWDKLQTYHLDVPEEYVDAFSEYVGTMNDIANDYGAKFLYVMIPNKETIYYENISKGYNIDYDNDTKSDKIIKKLNQKGIHNVYLRDYFLEIKNDVLLYNIKNDAGHWNYNGAFCGAQEIYKYLIDKMDVPVSYLKREDFDVFSKKTEYMIESFIRIDEEYPQYALKEENYVESDEEFWNDFEFIDSRNYHSHTINEQMISSDKPSLLIFGDSYILKRERLFANNFSEVMIVHRAESPKMRYYMEKLKPDIVILETTERVVGPDLDCNYEFLDRIKEY